MPIYQTSTFRFETADEYAETISLPRARATRTRAATGTRRSLAFERVMADLERHRGGVRLRERDGSDPHDADGAAATGDRMVASTELYGGTHSLLKTVMPRYGIEVDLRRRARPRRRRARRCPARARSTARRSRTRTSRSPTSRRSAPRVARRASPASSTTRSRRRTCARPPRLGFDFVVHSATKYVSGHNDVIAGVVCASEDGIRRVRDIAIETGGTMAPFEAWLCLRGLATLELRMERHTANAIGGRGARSRATRRSSACITPRSRRTRSTSSRARHAPARRRRHDGVRGRGRPRRRDGGSATRSSSRGSPRASAARRRSSATPRRRRIVSSTPRRDARPASPTA